ncbi:DNA helicase MCM8-like [Prorops nasuta]|uniref:DNA helicase MCM8-like n=1 Tax=Prorops nasuta TaxID=863751 RepID=UPI0034CE92DF
MRIAGYYKKCTMSVISSSSSIFVEEYFDLDRNVDSFENIWRSYFFLEEYREDSLTLKKICAVKDFFERHQEMFQFSKFESDGVTYDMLPLLADDIFLYQWPTFELDVQFNPQHTLACLQFAANQVLKKKSSRTMHHIKSFKMKNYLF